MMRLLSLAIIVALLHPSDGAVGVYDIGNNRPEGIHVLPDGAADAMGLEGEGAFALVSEFYYGGIKAVNLETGSVTQIVNSATSFGERGTIGLWYYDGVILAASGGEFVGENNEPALFVFDAATGQQLAKCLPQDGAGFLNDVTVINGIAYVTDSLRNSIMTLDVEAAKSGECISDFIETPADIFLSDDIEIIWSANAQNDVPGPLTAWELSIENGIVSATFVGTIESEDYDSPATCDVSGNNIYSPNARFGIGLPAEGEDDLASFGESFQVVGVNRMEFSPIVTTTDPPVSTTPIPCKTVTTQAGFDLATYISDRWYSQQQRPSPFQPPTLNYCTTADYSELDPSQSGFDEAWTIKVFNTAQDVDGNIFTSDDEAQVGPDPGPLCGLQATPDADPAKLLVGNCFEDPLQPFGSGPYWVLEYDEDAGYALISGGQPDVPTENGFCTFSSPFNGLWIFTRDSERDDALVEAVTAMAVTQGIDPSSMLPVSHEDCVYPEVPTAPTSAPPTSKAVTLTPKNYNGCMKVNGAGDFDDDFLLATCDGSDPLQQFVFDGMLIRLAVDESHCVQAGRPNPEPSHGHFLRVFPCDASNPQQQFAWDAPGGTLTLVQFPSLVVVFRGVTADVNEDRIIIGDLGREGVAKRKDWVIL